MSDGPVKWVAKDAVVLPVLPPELGVDPLLAALLHCAAFLELSGDEAVDPDWAVEALEHVAHYINQLSPEAIAAVQTQLDRVIQYGEGQAWPAEVIRFVRDFLVNCGVGANGEENG